VEQLVESGQNCVAIKSFYRHTQLTYRQIGGEPLSRYWASSVWGRMESTLLTGSVTAQLEPIAPTTTKQITRRYQGNAMRITLMVGEHIAPIQFALRLRIPRGSRLRVRPCRGSPDIIGANSLWQKSWQAEAHPTWGLKLLIHRSGAGAFACEPSGTGLLPQAAKLSPACFPMAT
jgi:hypothetical protein